MDMDPDMVIKFLGGEFHKSQNGVPTSAPTPPIIFIFCSCICNNAICIYS